MVVSCLMGVGNQTQALWMSSQCSQMLSISPVLSWEFCCWFWCFQRILLFSPGWPQTHNHLPPKHQDWRNRQPTIHRQLLVSILNMTFPSHFHLSYSFLTYSFPSFKVWNTLSRWTNSFPELKAILKSSRPAHTAWPHCWHGTPLDAQETAAADMGDAFLSPAGCPQNHWQLSTGKILHPLYVESRSWK